eukprot:TRINITY_DN3247_c0_g2_i1.p2 TRINITY_DN3247_c0_g2~~TRINITY_DN3247_c0_g2_i1.p2  ORF type:complete len:324 (-),score=24.41 TRINITY_DN3247_c0_g2_i1:365-1336(-)
MHRYNQIYKLLTTVNQLESFSGVAGYTNLVSSKPQQLCTSVYVCEPRSRHLFNIIKYLKHHHQVTPTQCRNYANKIIQNIKINKNIEKCQKLSQLIQILNYNILDLDEINVSTAAVTTARIISGLQAENIKNEEDVLDDICDLLCTLILQHVGGMEAQAVSNSLWSLGKIVDVLGLEKTSEYEIQKIFGRLCDRAMIIVSDMSIQGISNILWAMAKLEWKKTKQVQELVEQSLEIITKDCTPQDISNIVWAMATLNYEDLEAIEVFVQIGEEGETHITPRVGVEMQNSLVMRSQEQSSRQIVGFGFQGCKTKVCNKQKKLSYL